MSIENKLDMSLDDIAPPSSSGGRGRGRGRGRGGRGGAVRRSGGRSNRSESTPYSRKSRPGNSNVKVEKRSGNSSRRGSVGTSLYVGNLSWETSWQDLKDHMRQCGEVSRADVMEGPDGRSKGCGLVTYEDSRDAARAIRELTDSELQGRQIFVREDREAGTVGRSNGGGGRRGDNGGGTSVYVGNLSWDTSWQDLKDHMRQCGEVSRADVMEFPDGRSKGCGLVTFEDSRDAARAIRELTDSDLQGRQIFVREDREADGGGGGGGGGGSQRPSRGDGGRREVSNSEVSLYVGNIPWDLSWQDLKDAFAEYDCAHSDVGELRNGRARGFGIIKVPNKSIANRAIKEMNEAVINGREICVRYDEQ